MRSSATVGSTGPSLIANFEAAATATGARVLFATAAELRDLAASYAQASNGTEVGLSSDVSRLLGLETRDEAVTRPDVWLSRARLGIASTGTLLVAERRAEDRIPALLCTKHVLLLPSRSVVATHANAAEALRTCVADGLGYVTLISGPSRTSDIEKIVTLGAHGPAELDVILVAQWDPGHD
jgi:L-lactate dehydrogenase complex protein LldG